MNVTDEILDLLEDGALTATAIAGALLLPKNSVNKALDHLCSVGAVELFGPEPPEHPIVSYALSEREAARRRRLHGERVIQPPPATAPSVWAQVVCGGNRRRYATQQEALTRSLAHDEAGCLRCRQGMLYGPWECEGCGGWHLGHDSHSLAGRPVQPAGWRAR